MAGITNLRKCADLLVLFKITYTTEPIIIPSSSKDSVGRLQPRSMTSQLHIVTMTHQQGYIYEFSTAGEEASDPRSRGH